MFGKQIPLFRLFGFDVGIDPTWVMIAVLVTWSLAVGLFPSYYPGLSPLAAWSMGVVGAAGLFASIIFHELSHSLVARRFGLPIGGITLWIFGGVAHMEGEPEAPKVEFWMAIAGPVSSYVLAGGFVLAAWAGDGLAWPVTVTGVFWYLAAINGVLATFNLVPAFPMDGGRVLRAILWARSGNFREATRIASGLGGLFGLGLMAAAAFFLLQGNLVAAVWWFLIGLFVRFAARSSY
ncbi:MAG: site-2 protease family protein, partial [Alphaproteobacteria bacterium]